MHGKAKLSIYWASSCGGCEIAVVNLHERLLDIDANFDLVFCPCLMDAKKRDLEAMPDESIAVTLFNGAIRNSENEEMARLLRRKSQVLVAFGACAMGGGIPALSNLHGRERHLETCYGRSPTLDNPTGVRPQERVEMPEGVLQLPGFSDRVHALTDVVDVDYRFPGCPPESSQVWGVIDLLIRDAPLPSPGSVLGAGRSTVCDECTKTRQDKKLARLRRIWEETPDPAACLLDQGFLCMGPATRDGCGALCPQVQMPCIGCYGAPEGVQDQGGKMAAALGSMFDITPLKGLPEEKINARVDAILDANPDFAGTFYKFSLADALLSRVRSAGTRGGCEDHQD